jgi:hypothetical protein
MNTQDCHNKPGYLSELAKRVLRLRCFFDSNSEVIVSQDSFPRLQPFLHQMDPVDPFFSKFLAVSLGQVYAGPSQGKRPSQYHLFSWFAIDHLRRDQTSPPPRGQEEVAITGNTAVLGHAPPHETERIHRSGIVGCQPNPHFIYILALITGKHTLTPTTTTVH